jgi:hypothetical protein
VLLDQATAVRAGDVEGYEFQITCEIVVKGDPTLERRSRSTGSDSGRTDLL